MKDNIAVSFKVLIEIENCKNAIVNHSSLIKGLKKDSDQTEAEVLSFTDAIGRLNGEIAKLDKPVAADDSDIARVRNGLILGIPPRIDNNMVIFLEETNEGKRYFKVPEELYFEIKKYLNSKLEIEKRQSIATESRRLFEGKALALKDELTRHNAALKDYKARLIKAEEIAGTGGEKDFSTEQASERKEEINREIEAKPERLWKAEMRTTDAAMPRSTEDLIDVLSETQKAALPKKTKELYDAKKALRALNPKPITKE